jgi:carbohydrate diacid regulator
MKIPPEPLVKTLNSGVFICLLITICKHKGISKGYSENNKITSTLFGGITMSEIFQTSQLGSDIVLEIHNLIKEDVILTSKEGIIVASTDSSRLHEFHEGALLAAQNKKRMLMTEVHAKTLQGVRKGIVLPIIIQDEPLGVIGITGNPEVVEPYAMLVQKVTELFIQDSIVQTDQERQAREIEFFVFDWFNNKGVSKSLVDRSRFLDIKMEQFEQVTMLQTKDEALQLSYQDINLLKQMWSRSDEQTLFIRWGQNKLLILTPRYEKLTLSSKLKTFLMEIKKTFKMEVAVGIGNPITYQKLHLSYEQAERACEVSMKNDDIVFEQELRFDILQYGLDEDTKLEFTDRTIGAIKNEYILLETLDYWFRNDMSIQETAKKMHIHKNTPHYRLKKIEELTQLDLHTVHHIVILYISYRFLFDRTN